MMRLGPVLFVVLAACGGPARERWRPVGAAEHVVVSGDTTLRVTPDGDVDMVVTLHDGADTAVGSAVVHADQPSAALVAKHRRLAVARAWYVLAKTRAAEPARAAAAANAGLDALAPWVPPRGMIDDSSFFISSANRKLATDPTTAAAELTSVLVTRLHKYTMKWRAEVR